MKKQVTRREEQLISLYAIGIGFLILIITIVVNVFQTLHLASLESQTVYISRVDRVWLDVPSRTSTKERLGYDVTARLKLDGEVKYLELNSYVLPPKVGDEVEVKYDPKSPGKLIAFKFSDIWYGGRDQLAYVMSFFFLCLGFFGLGSFSFWSTLIAIKDSRH